MVEPDRHRKGFYAAKRTTMFFMGVLLIAAELAACAPLKFEEYPEDGAAGAPSVSPEEDPTPPGDGELHAQTRLMPGTLRLEGTGDAVTADQAAVLLPLRQEWRDLDRDPAAASDRQSLPENIRSAMTPIQLEAIDSMGTAAKDIGELARENGFGFPPASGAAGRDSILQFDPDERATVQSVYVDGSGGRRGPEWMLLPELLEQLQSKLSA